MGINAEMPPLQAEGSLDYEGFITHLKYLLDASWGEEWGSFSPDGPNVTNPTDVNYPIILYYMNTLVPGRIGNEAREIKPRLRYTVHHEEVNGTQPPATKIYGQVMDAEVIFEIWEETNAKVEKITKQFRQLLQTYTGYFLQKGLKSIQFDRYETDLTNGRIRDSYKTRKLVYHIRFEELMEMPSDIFRVIEVVEQHLKNEPT